MTARLDNEYRLVGYGTLPAGTECKVLKVNKVYAIIEIAKGLTASIPRQRVIFSNNQYNDSRRTYER